MNPNSQAFRDELNAGLAQAGLSPFDPSNPTDATRIQQFEDYLSLILRWNTRVNLTSIRDDSGIITRHFVESIACARALPPGIITLLDFGSGAGFPGIPIALCRPEIAVTVAESQGKKAAFLQEAIRILGISAKVHAQRAELLTTHFDCVVLRAVDRMSQAVGGAARLVRPGGWLTLMTTGSELTRFQDSAGSEFIWQVEPLFAADDHRILAFGRHAFNGDGGGC
jgi:16S rRNA (guanine527-N7)-methyltransferase